MVQAYDIGALRAQFPILSGRMRGESLIYLDNSATSLKPQRVLNAIDGYNRDFSANIHRGVYELSERATLAYDEARDAVKRLIGANDSLSEVIFTRGTTESINLVAFAWALNTLGPGDEIVLTPIEHHSNLVPWQQVARRTGASLVYIQLDENASIAAGAVERAIRKTTRLVAISGMSNVTGYVPPLDMIVGRARDFGARVLVDGAQLVSHHTVDVEKLGCDFLAFSGHKMCGPTGIGALYARRELLEMMDPYQFGGDMISTVDLYETTWARIPEKFEAGTPNVSGAIGMGEAARFLIETGMDAISEHERDLTMYMTERLDALPWVVQYGEHATTNRAGICSFNVEGVHAHDVGSFLDQKGIAVRTGFHCAQPLMKHFGVTGTVRASFYLYNTRDEIDRFIETLERIYAILN